MRRSVFSGPLADGPDDDDVVVDDALELASDLPLHPPSRAAAVAPPRVVRNPRRVARNWPGSLRFMVECASTNTLARPACRPTQRAG
jgi:hypothetical protein